MAGSNGRDQRLVQTPDSNGSGRRLVQTPDSNGSAQRLVQAPVSNTRLKRPGANAGSDTGDWRQKGTAAVPAEAAGAAAGPEAAAGGAGGAGRTAAPWQGSSGRFGACAAKCFILR